MFGLGSAVSICQTASLKLFGEIFYSEPKRCGIGRIVSTSSSLLPSKTASACIATFVLVLYQVKFKYFCQASPLSDKKLMVVPVRGK